MDAIVWWPLTALLAVLATVTGALVTLRHQVTELEDHLQLLHRVDARLRALTDDARRLRDAATLQGHR